MSDTSALGRFVWHELMTHDVDAGVDFYSAIVGWKTQAWEHDSSYRMLMAGGAPVGGAMTLPEEARAMGAPPHWMTYIGTPDVDDTVRQAESLGAEVLRTPDDIPNGGRFAILRDPQGAVFAVYAAAPGTPPPADASPGPGEFSWHELVTTDLDAALAFYQELFGWEKLEAMDMGPGLGIYQLFGWGGRMMGGMYVKPADMPAPCHWLPYAKVGDAKRAAAEIAAAGGTILHGPAEVPGGDWIAVAMDPQGVAFAVHSSAPAVAKPQPAPQAKPAKAAPRPVKKAAARKAAKKKAARKTAKKGTGKTAKKSAKKAAKKAAKRSGRKAARRGARPARKAAKRGPKRATRSRPGKRAARRAPKRAGRRRGAKRR